MQINGSIPVTFNRMDVGDPREGEMQLKIANLSKVTNIEAQEAEALKKAAQEFESYFLYVLLKEMRKTVDETKMIHGGRGEEIFRDRLDEELTKEMAKPPDGIGIARLLYEQLARPTPTVRQRAIDAASTPVQGESIPLKR